MLSEKKRLRGRVPILMVASLIIGVAAAVAHHLFYQSLDHEIVKSVNQQQWFLRIGTGLAFIAKMMLAAAAGIAYTQALWWTLQSRPVTVDGIDSFFGVVYNAWHFTSGELWYKGTLLLLLAMVIWALPIVAIVTPAALTVQPAPAPSERSLMVSASTIDYNISSVGKWASYGVAGAQGYRGPSYRISRLATSVASQGAILQIHAPFPNCSYTTRFYGPSLSCASLTQSSNATLWNGTNSVLQPIGDENVYDYVAWVPSVNTTGNLSFEATVLLGLEDTIGVNNSVSGDVVYLDDVSPDYARLYIYTITNEESLNTQILECGLFNTSFTVNFTYSDGQQNLQVTDSTRLNGVTGVAFDDVETNKPTAWAPYVALMHAFGNLLGGYLVYSHYDFITGTSIQITNTVLVDTVEMQYIFNQSRTTAADSLTIANMTMMAAVEEMFMNTTLSLFSDSYYLKSGDLHPIIVRSPQNMYSYDSAHLLTAYGVGIFVTVVVIAIGFFVLWTSQNTFGASFSAILRTTRNPELDVLITAEDTTEDGATRSKRLGQTPLVLRWELADGVKRAFFAIGGQKPVVYKDKPARREADGVDARVWSGQSKQASSEGINNIDYEQDVEHSMPIA